MDRQMARNHTKIVRVERIYRGAIISYSAICGVCAFFSANVFLEGGDFVNKAAVEIVCKVSVVFIGIFGILKRNDKLALLTLAPALINTVVAPNQPFMQVLYNETHHVTSGGFKWNIAIFIYFVILAAATIWANRTHAFLEHQFGFPHFLEWRAEDEFARNRNIKDEYTQSYEAYIKAQTDDMGEVRTNGVIERKQTEKKDYMDGV